MTTYVALFRGVNVGGHHLLSMKVLKGLLEQHGCVDVRTYVQSGNAVFRSSLSDTARVSRALSAAVSRSHGFEPRTFVLTRSELEDAVARNPFPEAGENPKSLHLFFLAAVAKRPDIDGANALKAESERFALEGRVFYLHTPAGFGTSKLASRVERLLGVEATARNWRTVTTLLEMARDT
jgi:uncharacterized protein (DUF1697 family)